MALDETKAKEAKVVELADRALAYVRAIDDALWDTINSGNRGVAAEGRPQYSNYLDEVAETLKETIELSRSIGDFIVREIATKLRNKP